MKRKNILLVVIAICVALIIVVAAFLCLNCTCNSIPDEVLKISQNGMNIGSVMDAETRGFDFPLFCFLKDSVEFFDK